MDVYQLRVLRELGERGSVSAVADALYVTPSAVSQQLRALQRTAPVPLTERAGRRLRLTDAGAALAAAAAEVEVALERARRCVDDYLDAPAAPVSVCGFHSAASALFPVIAAGPPDGSIITFADEDVAQHEFPALTGTYDVVLAHRLDHASPWPDHLAVTPLLHEPLDVALPVAHPLSAKARLTARDVSDEAWISVHDGFPLIATLDALGAAAGRPLRLVHRVNDFALAARLVAAGSGLALLPRWTAQPPPGVVLRPLSGVRANRHVDALCRPERVVRRGVAEVLAALRTAARSVRSTSTAG